MPFDVSRAYDEASGHADPRVWTASATSRCGRRWKAEPALLPPLPGEGWGGGKAERRPFRALSAPIPTFPQKGKEQDKDKRHGDKHVIDYQSLRFDYKRHADQDAPAPRPPITPS
jgi:hypothetical protein